MAKKLYGDIYSTDLDSHWYLTESLQRIVTHIGTLEIQYKGS